MEMIRDASYSDVFLCDGDGDFHDYHYVSPFQPDENSLLYRVHRTGIVHALPTLFAVERSASTIYGEIFCIRSGHGYLEYDGKTYELHRNQLVLLPAHEPHKYRNDPNDPMGKVWLEFYGANTTDLIRHLIGLHGPVLEGPLFPDICAQVCLIQQRLMVNSYYQPSLEIYRVLLSMLQYSEVSSPLQLTEDSAMNFLLVEAYINAHMSRKIANAELADLCGISLQHFIKQFKEHYHQTPQEYIMNQRIKKAQYTLVQTNLSIDSIAESLGFCNTSHFIRRFSEATGLSPVKYRKAQIQRIADAPISPT